MATLGCEPAAPPVVPQAKAIEVAPPAPADTCQRNGPDCTAACALRAIDRLEYVAWFDQRCAAVTLGKNADRAVGTEPPPAAPASAGPSTGSDVFSNPYR